MSKENLKSWLEYHRNQNLNKMGVYADNPVLKGFYEKAADRYMMALIKLAVNE
jgi:hypothetical protein